jgi:hypothetical protein
MSTICSKKTVGISVAVGMAVAPPPQKSAQIVKTRFNIVGDLVTTKRASSALQRNFKDRESTEYAHRHPFDLIGQAIIIKK